MKEERKVRSCAVCGGANRTRRWQCCCFDCMVEYYRRIERANAQRRAEKYSDFFPFWPPEVVADYQREVAKVAVLRAAARRPRLVALGEPVRGTPEPPHPELPLLRLVVNR